MAISALVDLGVYAPCDPDYLTGLSRCRADLSCTQCLGMEEYLCHQDPVSKYEGVEEPIKVE